jgi:hypothetical protein
MVKIGEHAAAAGWTVTSGHADGADYAFERGAKGSCIIYLPWEGFNAGLPILGRPVVVVGTEALDDMVREFHRAPGRLSRGGWALMRRNACQILGMDLNEPVDAVVCWTRRGIASGGTGQAMRIAGSRGIPVINMFPEAAATDVIRELGVCPGAKP